MYLASSTNPLGISIYLCITSNVCDPQYTPLQTAARHARVVDAVTTQGPVIDLDLVTMQGSVHILNTPPQSVLRTTKLRLLEIELKGTLDKGLVKISAT
jgi:hypothetical protein